MIPLFSASIANSGIDLQAAVARVIDSHWYVLGKEVAEFEREFAAHVGTRHCASLANGTDALELALRCVGVVRGDGVACVANAGFYGSTAIHAIGAKPLYVDVDVSSMNMSAEAFDKVIELRPKAVIVTHLYGQLADIEAILNKAQAAGIRVIEDCAQSHGAMRKGRRAGSFADLACFSFYPTKNLGALGDGGAVVCNDDEFDATVRQLRQYGWSGKYDVAIPHGRNSRLDEMQAAILRNKLPLLDEWNSQRRSIAARYNEAFTGLPLLLPPSLDPDFVAHLYVVRTDRRDELRAHLKAKGVASDVHYPIPDHLQSAYSSQPHMPLSNTESACRSVLTLPCFPGLADHHVATVIEAVRSFFDSSGIR